MTVSWQTHRLRGARKPCSLGRSQLWTNGPQTRAAEALAFARRASSGSDAPRVAATQ